MDHVGDRLDHWAWLHLWGFEAPDSQLHSLLLFFWRQFPDDPSLLDHSLLLELHNSKSRADHFESIFVNVTFGFLQLLLVVPVADQSGHHQPDPERKDGDAQGQQDLLSGVQGEAESIHEVTKYESCYMLVSFALVVYIQYLYIYSILNLQMSL